jgi:LacI family transcriptional regulator
MVTEISEPAPSATRRPTMKDVARLADVSLSTVSRVVAGDVRVDHDKAERVQQASRLLGYRRDHTASTLRRSNRQSSSIGLIWDDVANPFFSQIHRGVEEVARHRGVLALVGSSDRDADIERLLAESFSSRGVDGLIIAPSSGDQSYLQRDRDAGTALVFVDRPPSMIAADSVVSDNAGGIRAAITHLHAHGHRRIAYLGGRRGLFPAHERLRGYREAMQELRLDVDDDMVRIGVRPDTAAEEVDRILALSTPPTAFVTGQNQVSIAVLDALHKRELQHRIALIGYDDVPMATILDPGITVVAPDATAIGRVAAELLFSRLDGYQGEPRSIVVPSLLVARGSGELPVDAGAVLIADGDRRHPDLPTFAQLPVVDGAPPHSSWGVFGPDDQVGTLNFVTSGSVAAAAQSVTHGRVFPLSWKMELPGPAVLGRRDFEHHVVADEVGREDYYDAYYPQSSSQWDSLAHVRHPEHGFYNGHAAEAVAGEEGTLGIHNWARRGIAGRFVLLDVARHRRLTGDPLDPSVRTAITADELEAVRDAQGTELHSGDILLLRFGWTDYYETLDADGRAALTRTLQFPAPGIGAGQDVAAWLWDHRVAAVAGDNPALEAMPFDQTSDRTFAHYRLIALLGMAVGEMFWLRDLAADCEEDASWDGLFVSAPFNKFGGVGSPANAIALR